MARQVSIKLGEASRAEVHLRCEILTLESSMRSLCSLWRPQRAVPFDSYVCRALDPLLDSFYCYSMILTLQVDLCRKSALLHFSVLLATVVVVVQNSLIFRPSYRRENLLTLMLEVHWIEHSSQVWLYWVWELMVRYSSLMSERLVALLTCRTVLLCEFEGH